MNQLLEWSPLIVFFIVFKVYGIYWATASLMVTSVALMSSHKLSTGRYKKMHIVTVVVVLILGSATLLMHDKRFIQWKPTVLLGFAAAAFLVSTFFGHRPWRGACWRACSPNPRTIAAGVGPAEPDVDRLVCRAGAANIYIAQHFAETVWVNFKVFGITAAMLVFMIPQVIWLSGRTRPVQPGGG